MNLLNLMLTMLIFTIEPFTSFVFNTNNNGLVFIKPENLTKTELVEKFKKLSSSKSLKDLENIKEILKSYYLKLSAFIFKFKFLITKIALFTILIKYIKNFKLLRFI
jgi:hypothetical protein